MQWRNTAEKYGLVGQTLHWLVVFGIIASYFIAEAAEDEEAGVWMGLHRSIGITILGLAILRVLWRLVDRTPPWPATMAGYERVIARATHGVFYLLLFAMPLTGWLLSSAEGELGRYFGLFDVPALPIGASEGTFEEVHEALFNILLAFAGLHVLGALKHHFWNRDHVLRSMLPGKPPGTKANGNADV